jgi:metallo-beta-lactamase class B
MKTSNLAALAISTLFSLLQSAPPLQADPPRICDDCDEWNRPLEPFKLFGNTYYVGTTGLSSLLITTSDGLILLDGGLPQSAPLIDANIRKLGFRTRDVRLIVNSHAHYDHAGGIAALQRASGARVAASVAGAKALQRGEPTEDDPQYGFGREANAFRAVENVHVAKDGEAIRVGNAAITPHYTPGHTPGSTTWTWQSCEGARCLSIVYADSLTAVSAPGFRYSGDGRGESPGESFARSITRVEQLPCDILVAPHPSATGLPAKLARLKSDSATNPFIDPGACRVYAAGARKRLDERLAEEKKVAERK